MTYYKAILLTAIFSLGACATSERPEAPMDKQYLKSYGSPLVYDLIQGKQVRSLPNTQVELDKIDIALKDKRLTDLGRLALTEYRAAILTKRDDRDGVRTSYAALAQSVSNPNMKRFALLVSTKNDADTNEGKTIIEPVPLVRVPPAMPNSVDNTGFCRLKFDVQPDGSPTNVKTTYCTRDIFEASAVKSVSKWKYAVSPTDEFRYGIVVILRFRLTNERGLIKPY